MKQKNVTRITLGTLLLSAAFLFGGCAEKVPVQEETTTPFTLDIANVHQAVIDADVFEDELAVIDVSYIEMLTGIATSDFLDGIISGGSGATAEFLAIFETADETAAAALKEKCEAYVTKQVQSYADYMPAEVDKLNHAVIKSSGSYVILCVAGNYETAGTVIAEYFP
ncbi:MAG: DUF4358 domain-containing protein [Alistipes sp.]|nr:DUF4358 domain-containing protein [Alistipes sp.]